MSACPVRRALIYLLVFVGGFSVMGIQLLGGRMLAPYFGSSVHVWGSIITVFMLALSIGYLLGGRFSLGPAGIERIGFILIGCVISILPLVLWANPLMDWLFIRIEDPRYGSLVTSMLLFFIPSMCLGFISPYAIRLMVDEAGHSGHIAGKLYFVSTAGSALGTLMTSFYFVLWFEVNTILLGVAGSLLTCGLLALGYYFSARKIS